METTGQKPRINLSKVEEILQGVENRVLTEFSAISPKAISDSIIKDFNDAKAEVLYKLMGFKKDGRRWEIDHCNGRAGNSPIGTWIASACEEELLPIIRNILKEEVDLQRDRFTKRTRESIQYEINRMFSSYLYDEIKKAGKMYVEEMVKEQADLIRETVKQKLLEKEGLLDKDG